MRQHQLQSGLKTGRRDSRPLACVSHCFYWQNYMLHPMCEYVSYSGSALRCCRWPWISRSRLSMDSARSWFGISWLASKAVLQNPSAWHTNRSGNGHNSCGCYKVDGGGWSKADLYNGILENWTVTQLALFVKWNVWSPISQAFLHPPLSFWTNGESGGWYQSTNIPNCFCK